MGFRQAASFFQPPTSSSGPSLISCSAPSVIASNATSATVNYPSSPQSGDLLLIVIVKNSTNPTITTPSGWTALSSAASHFNSTYGAAFWKVASGSESGAVTVSASSGNFGFYGGQAVMLLIRGQNASPIDSEGIGSSASGISCFSNSPSASTSNGLLIAVGYGLKTIATSFSATEDNGTIESVDNSAIVGVSTNDIVIASKALTASGPAGATTFVWSSSANAGIAKALIIK